MGGGSRSAPLLSYREPTDAPGLPFAGQELHTPSRSPAPAPRRSPPRPDDDPLATERARLALTRFKRTVVHAAHADEERALIEWSKRIGRRAKIRKRRDVQFETFKFCAEAFE